MASDQDYASFLDQANQGTGASKASPKASIPATKAVDTDVPASLQKIDRYYSSEADEPFESVSLKWSKPSLPSGDDFVTLIGHKGGDVARVSPEEWDPKEHYRDVVKAVKDAAAGSSEVKIYRLEKTKTRLEFYVVALDTKHGRIVGVKTKAVES